MRALEVHAAGGDLVRRPAQRRAPAWARGRATPGARAPSPPPARASAGRAGRSRAQRGPSMRISRRWISIARSSSISCSVIAPSSASHANGRRRMRTAGFARTACADERVVAEAVVERPQVVVHAEREAHAGDPLRGRRLGLRAGAEDHPLGRGLDDRHVDALAARVQQPLQRGAAAAQQAVHRRGAEPERPRRPDLDAQLDRGRARPAAASIPAKEVDVDQERVRGDDLPQPAGLAPCAGGAGRACGGGARPPPSRRRPRSRWRRARPPGGRARAPGRRARSPRPARPGRAARPRPRRRLDLLRVGSQEAQHDGSTGGGPSGTPDPSTER